MLANQIRDFATWWIWPRTGTLLGLAVRAANCARLLPLPPLYWQVHPMKEWFLLYTCVIQFLGGAGAHECVAASSSRAMNEQRMFSGPSLHKMRCDEAMKHSMAICAPSTIRGPSKGWFGKELHWYSLEGMTSGHDILRSTLSTLTRMILHKHGIKVQRM